MIDLSREEILAGLRAGRTLVIDRRDSPTLPTVREMEREGLVTTDLVQQDEQSSVLKVRLAPGVEFTTSGKALTPADFERLADEAEQGYDVDKLMQRRGQ